MKFVGLIQKYSIEARELNVSIPHYHRSSMGLRSKTSVYAVPRYYSGQNGSEFREIILTPFNPKSWGDLWKIEMTTKEFPGVVKQITSVISEEKINILVQESLTTEQDKTHAIMIIADMINYEGDSNNSNRIKDLNFDNLANLKNKLINITNDRGEIITQSITIRRMEFLANNSLQSEDVNNTYGNEDFFNVPVSSLIDNRKAKLPYRIIKYLKINNEIHSVNASIFSDTEEKYLIVHLFNERQNIIAIDVVHDDARGAITAFTNEIIKVDKSINILNCFNRIESMSNISHWNVILDITTCTKALEELLLALKKCEYNSFNVKHVWLTDWINDPEEKLIIKYGQVKWKNETELNYAGEKKKVLIIKECLDKKISLEPGNETRIIHELGMQGSEEELDLIKSIIQENVKYLEVNVIERRRKRKKVLYIVLSFFIMLILISAILKIIGKNPLDIAKEQFAIVGKYLFLLTSVLLFFIVNELLHKYGDSITKIFRR